jgi:hypothetical protein
VRPGERLGPLLNPQAYAAGGRLWVVQQTSRPGSTVVSEIMRVNPVSTRVLSTLKLDATYAQALLTHHVLWVSTTTGRSVWLWRLQPDTLSVISKELLPGSVAGGQTIGAFGTLAAAGGWLWVGGWDTLDRVSLSTAQASINSRIPDAEGIDVASNRSGSVLIDSEGQAISRVQRRSPQTGVLLAQSPKYEGVIRPFLGGVIDGAIWLSEATGMMGYVQRISLTTLKPTRLIGTPPHPGAQLNGIEGTNGITARVMNNILWVTQTAGGATVNYCGNPKTGKPSASLKLPDAATGNLLTASPTDIYYLSNMAGGPREQLNRRPIHPHC